jgi:steroid delta-isomerase-like uncharacterized protein
MSPLASTSDMLYGNERLIYRFTEECWNGGNLAMVRELVAEHCSYHDPVFPHMAPGVKSMQRHIERCRRAFPDLKFTISDIGAKKGEVEVHWTACATQAAEFLGMPATDKYASIIGTSLYRIEAGKIVEHWVNWDLMSLMAQLGAGAASGQEVEPKPHAESD